MRALALAVFSLALALGPLCGTAAAQSGEPTPVPAAPPAASIDLGGVTIDGPPPPEPPAHSTRNAAGRVTIRAVRLPEGLNVDGNLNEEIYATLSPITDFIQTNPQRGAPATEKTEAWVFFDDDNLYIGARCYDSSPESEWVANELRRDNNNIIRNENVAVLLDTFYDRRTGVLFEVTPIGALWDGTVASERGPSNTDWNPVWDARSGRFPGGWSAEMVIPFKSLRYKAGSNQVWGINIRRTIRHKNEETFMGRMPQSTGSAMFMVSQSGTLVGLEVPPGSKNLEIKPYAISSVTTDRRATPAISADPDGDAGFDIKYGVTQNLTADFTYNTDFAQVEVDTQQVNLTRFSLFFPEKREFFLEGQNIYDFGGAASSSRGGGAGVTPLLFFSRRIGFNNSRAIPVTAGGRLTGRVGKFTVGLMNVRTGELEAARTLPTNFQVARIKRDILRRSSIGALYTGRSVSSAGGPASRSYGVDAAFGFFTDLNINAYFAKTDNPGLSGKDTSYRTQLAFTGDRWGVEADQMSVGANFRPEAGFMTRENFRRTYGSFRFSPRPRNSKLVRKYSYQVDLEYFSSGEGRLESRNNTADFGIEFQNSDRVSVTYNRNYELLVRPFAIVTGTTIPVGAYGFQDTQVGWTLGNQHKVSGALTLGHGSFYNGQRTTAGYSTGKVELSPRFSLEPILTRNWISLPVGTFTTTLIANRTTFTMTPRMFFSGLLQYNSTNRSLSSNLRFRWEYVPGSELFMVYTDERDTFGPGTDLRNRAFVVKINRLFRF
jgi:hypothetical protein